MEDLRLKMEEIERIEDKLLKLRKQQSETDREEMKLLLLCVSSRHERRAPQDLDAQRTTYMRTERELDVRRSLGI